MRTRSGGRRLRDEAHVLELAAGDRQRLHVGGGSGAGGGGGSGDGAALLPRRVQLLHHHRLPRLLRDDSGQLAKPSKCPRLFTRKLLLSVLIQQTNSLKPTSSLKPQKVSLAVRLAHADTEG